MNMTDYHSSTFKPVNGLMLIKVDPLDKVSKGGIKLVTQKAEPVDRGTIVAINNHGVHRQTGKEFTNDEFTVGDRVVFNYGVKEYIEFSDGMHVILDKSQIYCILQAETDIVS